MLSWALGAPPLLSISIRAREQMLMGGDTSRAHSTPPPIHHQPCLDLPALKKVSLPPACPPSSPETRSGVSQLCTAQQPRLLPPSLSSSSPKCSSPSSGSAASQTCFRCLSHWNKPQATENKPRRQRGEVGRGPDPLSPCPPGSPSDQGLPPANLHGGGRGVGEPGLRDPA